MKKFSNKFLKLAGVLAVILFFGLTPKAEAATRHYLIDFGASTFLTSTTGWNNVSNNSSDLSPTITSPLVDSTGANTSVTLAIPDNFCATTFNPNGTTASSLYPANASKDTLYLAKTSISTCNNTNDLQAIIVLGSLNASNTYDFRFYASRLGAGVNRTADYTIGATTVSLNATDNVDGHADITGVSPSSGSITATVAPNAAAANFAYLGVIDMTENYNASPSANAGTDQSITSRTSSVTLSGSGSDTDGTISTYAWTQTAGPITATIVSASSDVTSVTELTTSGTYTFRLTVTDNQGATGTDDIDVVVNSTTLTASVSVSAASSITTTTATLNGNITDTGGASATVRGFNYGLTTSYDSTVSTSGTFSTGAFSQSASGLTAGTLYHYRAFATNSAGTGNSADQTFTTNVAPSANTGTDQAITLPTHSVTLSGSGSDTDGTISTYAWTETTSLGATINSASSASTVVTDLALGTYTFRLTVTDNQGATATDDINVVVSADSTAGTNVRKIVVLGSSTSAGTGASPSSNSWVNLYATYLQGLNASDTVVNLAVGGYNTYKILATGSTPPGGRPSPDTAKNITAALTYNPNAIIINMPSNDAASGYTTNETEANFATVATIANNAGVPIWITTSQPRNLNSTGLAALVTVKDWINSTYGTHALDFWTDIANSDGTINTTYSFGDGIHINNAGHRKLYDRVAGSGLIEALVNQSPTVSMTDPSNGATVSGSSVTLSATASDDVGVVGVQFKLDTNTNIGAEDTVAAYSVAWDSTAVADGSHTIIAVARDGAGNYATSSTITVTVDNTAPVRSIGSPSGTLTYGTTGATLSLTTDENATCKYGIVSGTAYASIANTFTTTGATSHSASLTGLSNATSYLYYVRCQDGQGNNNSSDYTISFSVAADSTVPTVSLTAPISGVTVSGSTVTVSADASDNEAVAGVKFYYDDTYLIGSEDTSSLYSVVWDSTGVIDGSHTLLAVARDNTGNIATSSSVAVTVHNAVASTPAVGNEPIAGGLSGHRRNISNLLVVSTSAYLTSLQDQITSLTLQLNSLLAQKNIALGNTSNNFVRNLSLHAIGEDVRSLQHFLNANGFRVSITEAGSLGKETNYFGLLTKTALIKFQESHATYILTPNGLKKGTGYFGPSTRAFVNK